MKASVGIGEEASHGREETYCTPAETVWRWLSTKERTVLTILLCCIIGRRNC